MENKCKVIAIANQKGGVGKTVTSVCLGVCLAQDNKKVLIVDFDPQGSLTKGLGYRSPDFINKVLKIYCLMRLMKLMLIIVILSFTQMRNLIYYHQTFLYPEQTFNYQVS